MVRVHINGWTGSPTQECGNQVSNMEKAFIYLLTAFLVVEFGIKANVNNGFQMFLSVSRARVIFDNF
jgi:hypothetical protein